MTTTTRPTYEGRPVIALETLQFAEGGLLNSRRVDDRVHLVRCVEHGGTPGPTLCEMDRFRKGGPGWSLGGGVTGPGMVHRACPGCIEVAKRDYPGLPVRGMEELRRPVQDALDQATGKAL